MDSTLNLSGGLDGMQQVAAIESRRALRSGRAFTVVRIGFSASLPETQRAILRLVVAAEVRSTDFVHEVCAGELGVMLNETGLHASAAPIARVRAALERSALCLHFSLGSAEAGPGTKRTWQEAWRWAGVLLVADATVPAAA